MDAINKFTGFRPAISPEPQETQAAPEQSPTQTSSAGIASAPDAFETFQPATPDLSNFTTPRTLGDPTNTTPAPPPQGGTVEASSIFDPERRHQNRKYRDCDQFRRPGCEGGKKDKCKTAHWNQPLRTRILRILGLAAKHLPVRV